MTCWWPALRGAAGSRSDRLGVVAIDHGHLVRLANLMLTHLRQCLARQQHGRRGRKHDLAWAHRLLLQRADDRFSRLAMDRLFEVLRRDDPALQLGAAWDAKEQRRRLLCLPHRHGAVEERMRLGAYMLNRGHAGTRLSDTIDASAPRSTADSSLTLKWRLSLATRRRGQAGLVDPPRPAA